MTFFNPASFLSTEQAAEVIAIFKSNPLPQGPLKQWLSTQPELKTTLDQVPLDHSYWLYALEFQFRLHETLRNTQRRKALRRL